MDGPDRPGLHRSMRVTAALSAVLAAAALATAILLRPPLLAWAGFAVMALIVLGLGVAASLTVPRLRLAPPPPAVAADRTRRLLVVADAVCSSTALADAICRRIHDDVVHVVVPVRVSHLHFLTDDEARERRQAERSLSATVRLLHERHVVATGAVGDDKPLESMTDALGTFAATHVLLAIPPEAASYWLERELPAKARALAAVDVEHVVVPPALRPESSARDV
jgi:hypothetical protein